MVAAVAELMEEPAEIIPDTPSMKCLGALLARADLVVGGDTGPLHLAVATGTPTVHLFGPADPARFGPWGPPDRHRVVATDLPCAPCGRLDWPDPADHPCVRTIALARVVAAGRR